MPAAELSAVVCSYLVLALPVFGPINLPAFAEVGCKPFGQDDYFEVETSWEVLLNVLVLVLVFHSLLQMGSQ
jgi:hypothetical protein